MISRAIGGLVPWAPLSEPVFFNALLKNLKFNRLKVGLGLTAVRWK